MYHIKITDLSTSKTLIDADSNCIIGACEIVNEEKVQGFGVIQATRGTIRNVVTTLMSVVEDACTDGEDRSLYNRVMVPVILKAMKLMGGEPEDDDAEVADCNRGRDEHAD